MLKYEELCWEKAFKSVANDDTLFAHYYIFDERDKKRIKYLCYFNDIDIFMIFEITDSVPLVEVALITKDEITKNERQAVDRVIETLIQNVMSDFRVKEILLNLHSI